MDILFIQAWSGAARAGTVCIYRGFQALGVVGRNALSWKSIHVIDNRRPSDIISWYTHKVRIYLHVIMRDRAFYVPLQRASRYTTHDHYFSTPPGTIINKVPADCKHHFLQISTKRRSTLSLTLLGLPWPRNWKGASPCALTSPKKTLTAWARCATALTDTSPRSRAVSSKARASKRRFCLVEQIGLWYVFSSVTTLRSNHFRSLTRGSTSY